MGSIHRLRRVSSFPTVNASPPAPMKAWQSIVVGIDFSESSKAALREAAQLAHRHKCSLHVAHAVPMLKRYDDPVGSNIGISLVRDLVGGRLKTLCLEEIGFLTDLEYHILVGHPVRELFQLIHDIHPDLLVLGARGMDNQPHGIGVIATKCTRRAPVPVLIIREERENPYRTIVAAIDFSDTSLEASRLAAEIALDHQSHLHLVHVHEPLLDPKSYIFFNPEAFANLHDRDLEEFESKLRRHKNQLQIRFPDLTITTHLIEARRASEALLLYIREHDVSLAVFGTRGLSSTGFLTIGTTAERLIRDCSCSFLTVKPQDFESRPNSLP